MLVVWSVGLLVGMVCLDKRAESACLEYLCHKRAEILYNNFENEKRNFLNRFKDTIELIELYNRNLKPSYLMY